ncbi:uncharacterized protein YBL113C isoform X1 [Gymnodraco acuticeps]|uniref:Uncharacterized protein YBL113C isoform X1 n=1 Tax=Gymnodraco acuticeps TaxID=8218 RepID=A0A6P8TTI9_GYMAC|nr:uncharacterized protein YBL113C isoform X1 [Gymnodraco acuticeps]
MDTNSAGLACCLLALSIAVVQAENITTIRPIIPTSRSNMTNGTTMVPSPNSTVISNLTGNTTPFTSTTRDNETFTGSTATTNESTSHPSQATALTNTTSQITTTPGNRTPTLTATQTTAGNMSTPTATVITTATSSHTVNTTSDSMNRTTQGLRLNISEKNMTIVFSVVLGVFALALVGFMFRRCKHNIQYLHQPLNNTDDTADAFVADDDTLVISGGLYDGHPIYDNVPEAPAADRSQFRLQFLH